MPACSKTFSITVNTVDPTEWWKLDEPGPGSRTGVIAGVVLDDLVDPTGSSPGKIGLAANLASAPFGVCFLGTLAPEVPLAYAGNGFDAFGWINSAAFSTIPFQEFVLCSYGNGSNHIFNVQPEPWTGPHPAIVGPPCMRFNLKGDGPSVLLVVPFTFVAGDWIFWRVFYDSSAQRFGVQINNGPVILGGVQPLSATVQGTWNFQASGPGGSSWLFDETGIFMQKLSDASASTIYNSGAGKTFP